MVIGIHSLPDERSPPVNRSPILKGILPVLALALPAVGSDWPQWRGPARNGISTDTVRLANSWPESGPRKLWDSERVIHGYGCPVVVGGKVYYYSNPPCKFPADEHKMTWYSLYKLGFVPPHRTPPKDVVAKVEKARCSEERSRLTDRGKINQWTSKWTELNLDKAQGEKYRGFCFARMRAGRSALPLDTLNKLAQLIDRSFPGQAAFEKELLRRGLDRKTIQTVLPYSTNPSLKGYNGKTRADVIWCLDAASGKTVWKKSYPGSWNTWPRSGTVSVSGGRCYVVGSSSYLYCLAADTGELVWKENYRRFGEAPGCHSSPLVVGNMVVVASGKLAAFNAADGKLLWRSKETSGPDSSPFLWRSGGRDYAVNVEFGGRAGKGYVSCFDLANGKLMWKVPGGGNRNSPVVAGNILVVPSTHWGLMAFRISPHKAEVLWRLKDLNGYGADGGPIIHNGHVYAFLHKRAVCVDLVTGKRTWEQKGLRLPGWASPILVDGKIIVNSDNEQSIAMFAADPKNFTRLAEAKIGFMTWSSPAVANGRLYCRLKHRIACYDLRRSGKPETASAMNSRK